MLIFLEIFSEAIAGLGLFFVGVHILSENLRRQTGLLLNKLFQPRSAASWHRFIAGLVLGALTQTSIIAVFILASLTAAGLTTVKSGLPILVGVNVGTSVLIFLGSIDTRIIALIITGIVGIAINSTRFDVARPVLFSVFSVGLFFIGVDLLQDAGLRLSQIPSVQNLLSSNTESYFLGFTFGVLLRVIMMSGSAATLLLIGLSSTGLVTVEYTVITIYGVNFGAAVSTWLFSFGVKGPARDITYYQIIFDVLGVAILVPVFVYENLTSKPLVQALVLSLSDNVQLQMAYVYLLFNVVSTAALIIALRCQSMLQHRPKIRMFGICERHRFVDARRWLYQLRKPLKGFAQTSDCVIIVRIMILILSFMALIALQTSVQARTNGFATPKSHLIYPHLNWQGEIVDLSQLFHDYKARCFSMYDTQGSIVATSANRQLQHNLQMDSLGIYLLETAKNINPAICFEDRMDGTHGYYDYHYNAIVLQQSMNIHQQSITLVHELRHLEQILSNYSITTEYDIDEAARIRFAVEADAQAIATLFAWRIKNKGFSWAWNSLLQLEQYIDISKAFKILMNHSRSESEALLAAFRQWYASQWRIDAYYMNAKTQYLDLLHDTKKIRQYKALPLDYFDQLCKLPDESEYACDATSEITINPRSINLPATNYR